MSGGEQFIFFFHRREHFHPPLPPWARGSGRHRRPGSHYFPGFPAGVASALRPPPPTPTPSQCHALSAALLINTAHQCIPSYITPESSCQAPATSLSATALSSSLSFCPFSLPYSPVSSSLLPPLLFPVSPLHSPPFPSSLHFLPPISSLPYPLPTTSVRIRVGDGSCILFSLLLLLPLSSSSFRSSPLFFINFVCLCVR